MGTNLKQPQIRNTIVITVTFGQRNGIRKILKLKTVIFIVVFMFVLLLWSVEKAVEIPLVLMRYFDVQAFSLGTGVKV